MKRTALTLILGVVFAACGGGDAEPATDESTPEAEPATTPAEETRGPTGPITVPEWYSYDEASNTVNITLIAGETSRNNYWNYNGAINGELDIHVPVGATVTIEMVNEDPAMAHSVGVSDELENFAAPPPPNPVFEGAITEAPQSMTEGGLPGETETITFTADVAGEYSLVCYVPGHTAVGMWIYFTVSEDGDAGVQGL